MLNQSLFSLTATCTKVRQLSKSRNIQTLSLSVYRNDVFFLKISQNIASTELERATLYHTGLLRRYTRDLRRQRSRLTRM